MSRLADFYRTSESYRTALAGHDERYFAIYLDKVVRWIPPPAHLLDLGCGTGTSCRFLAARGYRVTGVDLSEAFLDRAALPAGVELVAADAAALPFPDAHFDAVASYEFLEHVTDVPRVLAEMGRVARPGGTVLVLCPNLLSPFIPGSALKSLLRGGPGVPVWGETAGGAALTLVRNTAVSALKTLGLDRRFRMREPDVTRPGVPDADAAYLAAPADLLRTWRAWGWRAWNAAACYSALERLLTRVLPSWRAECCVVAVKPRDVPI